MTRQAIPFADFSGGDQGRSRPLPGLGVSQFRTDYNVHEELKTYRGINTWRYPNGSLGPRPPWVAVAYTGLPTGKTLKCFQTAVHSSGAWLAWAFSDGTIYSLLSAGTVASLRGTLGSNPSDSIAIATDVLFVSNGAGGGGRVTNSGAYTAIPTMPQGDLLAQQASQTLVLRQSNSLLYWSAPDDPTSWPAANVVKVGDTVPANGLYVQRDTIIVTKVDGSVWMFTGTLGVNETLRRIDIGLTHPLARMAKGSVAGNSVLYYVTGSKLTAYTGAELKTTLRPDMPAQTGFDSDPHQDNVGSIVSTGELNSFLVLGTMDKTSDVTTRRPWWHSFNPDNGWNRHTFPVADYVVSATPLDGLTSVDSSLAIRTSQHINGAIFVCRPSDASGVSTLKHFVLVPRLETPYAVSLPLQWGTVSAVLDGDLTTPVVASAQLAEWWAPEGEECTVRALLVNYSYDSSATIAAGISPEIPNKFDIGVEAIQRMDGSTQASTAVTFVPTSGVSAAVDTGTMRRGKARFDFGDQGVGGGFRITLADWRGIQIHWITALVDVTGVRV